MNNTVSQCEAKRGDTSRGKRDRCLTVRYHEWDKIPRIYVEGFYFIFIAVEVTPVSLLQYNLKSTMPTLAVLVVCLSCIS